MFTSYKLEPKLASECSATKLQEARESQARSLQQSLVLSRRFHRPIYFSLNLSRVHIPTETSVTNCNHKHGLMLTCRHVYMRPHCFILTEACSCRLELTYFAGKISKNRLVCKNAVALAYCGSCRLPVIGSWPRSEFYLKAGSHTAAILQVTADYVQTYIRSLRSSPRPLLMSIV